MRNGLRQRVKASKVHSFSARIRAECSLKEITGMLADRYDPEDVFARVPEVAAHTDPVC